MGSYRGQRAQTNPARGAFDANAASAVNETPDRKAPANGRRADGARGREREDETQTRGAAVQRRDDGAQERADPPQGIVELVSSQIKGAVNNGLSQRVSKPADDLAGLAKALRFSAQQLEGNMAVPYIGKVAEQLEHAAKAISGVDAQEALEGLQRFARREPLLFLGGALVFGISGGRFLKSSARPSDLT